MLYLYTGKNKKTKEKEAQSFASELGQKIHRIDLNRVMSKYIGETEKNLAKLFIKAEKQHWILFFDEADALFGKRNAIKNSHERYESQETDHLLKYIERYRGIAILSTNNKSHFSEKFKRHFKQIHDFKQ